MRKMSKEDHSGNVLRRLDATPYNDNICPEAEGTFRGDLVAAITLRNNLGDTTFAPYVNPDYVRGQVVSAAPFPNQVRDPMFSTREVYYGSHFAFLVRPVDEGGRSTQRFYGVPLVMQDIVSLEDSGILDREISTVRVQGNLTVRDDKLLGYLSEIAGESEPRRRNQDVLLNLTYRQFSKLMKGKKARPSKG